MNNPTQNPPSTSVSDTESQLIELSLLIGSIAESNSLFTAGLASYIEKIGKPLSKLTVEEIVTHIQDYREAFNTGTEPKINTISLDELIARQDRERGFEPMPLEREVLLQRVKDGGHSGQFLADAFISSYRTNTKFNHSLGEIMKLDYEAIRLFTEILHIRFIRGWSDTVLYDIEQEIIAIMEVA